jgi:hypothetical protein
VLRYADLDASARRFSAARTLVRDATGIRPAIVTSGVAAASDAAGNLTVAWQRKSTGGWRVEVVTRSRHGRFSEPQLLATSPRMLHSLQVRAEARAEAVVVWEVIDRGELPGFCGGLSDPVCTGTWASLRRAGHWLPSQRLDTSDGFSFSVAAAGPDGTFVVVLTNPDGLTLHRAAPGEVFSRQTRLAVGSMAWVTGVDLTADGVAVAAWREAGSSAAVETANRAATVFPDGTISPLWAISPAIGSDALFPRWRGAIVRLNPSGEGLLVWHQTERRRRGVYVRRRRPDGGLDMTQRVFGGRTRAYLVPPLPALAADDTAAIAWTSLCPGSDQRRTFVALRRSGSATFRTLAVVGRRRAKAASATPFNSELARPPAIVNGRVVVLVRRRARDISELHYAISRSNSHRNLALANVCRAPVLD